MAKVAERAKNSASTRKMKMAKQTTMNFSHDSKDKQSVEVQLEKVGHPLVKQILSQVLAEDANDASLGSAFGEGQVAG